jgi:hypothetical protein
MESTRRPGGLEKFQVTDHEECGLIVTNDEGMLYVVKTENHASDRHTYEIWITDLQKVEEVLSPDERIVGFLHTHLSDDTCEPSDVDLDDAAASPNYEHMVYHPASGEFCWYGLTEVMG